MALRPRQPRRAVRIAVRVRTDTGWIDATVHNVSHRGMMLQSPQPLQRNQFVEIARGQTRVVGRIVWSDAARCGLQTQEAFDMDALQAGAGRHRPGGERRREARAPTKPVRSFQEQGHHARMIGRSMERAVVAIVGATFAALIAAQALDTLSRPFAQVEAVLAAP